MVIQMKKTFISPSIILILMLMLTLTLIPQVISVDIETNLYALIVADEEFLADGNYAYAVLQNYYNFKDVVYLKSSEATLANVVAAINSLKEKTTMGDMVLMYFTTHGRGLRHEKGDIWKLEDLARLETNSDEGSEINGSQIYEGGYPSEMYGVDECLILKGSGVEEPFYDDNFTASINDMKYYRLIVILTGCEVANETCFSGGFIDDLSSPNRIIISASNETTLAYSSTEGYGFFDRALWSALNPEETAFFEADVNENGKISMKEAFDYAYNYIQNLEVIRQRGGQTPWLDDDGDKFPTFLWGEDWIDYDDGALASETYLEGGSIDVLLKGDINDDGYVNYLDGILLGAAFNSTPNDPNWNPSADLNEDGYINYLDAIILGANFGQSVFPSGSSSNNCPSAYTLETCSHSTVLKVQPAESIFYTNQTSVGETFTISIIAEDVSDLYGWEFTLEWTAGVINCTEETINYAVWSDYQGPWLSNPIDNVNGKYHQSLTAKYPAEPFTGTTCLVNLTFQITQAPPEGSTISTNLTISPAQGTSYCLADETAFEIPHSFNHGTYQYTSPPPKRYMRGDQHTINSLTAYILGKNQSNIARLQSIGDYGSNLAYWGIRVWKRTAEPEETEITNGTPVAQVSRNVNGYGIQTATWNCPGISLTQTDTIIIRVYCKNGGPWTLIATFTTEQLNATNLQQATWTIHYWTQRNYVRTEEGWMTTANYRWGTITYNSHIENFLTQIIE